jgi:hypothetical protein
MDDALEVLPPIIGFDLSSVCTFFNDIPFLMSPNRASLPGVAEGNGAFLALGALGGGGPPIAGGGGGGGGGPAMVSWSSSFSLLSAAVRYLSFMSSQLSAAALTDFICPHEMAEKQGKFFRQ